MSRAVQGWTPQINLSQNKSAMKHTFLCTHNQKQLKLTCRLHYSGSVRIASCLLLVDSAKKHLLYGQLIW